MVEVLVDRMASLQTVGPRMGQATGSRARKLQAAPRERWQDRPCALEPCNRQELHACPAVGTQHGQQLQPEHALSSP